MARGGSRKHPADCKCGKCPKLGRPKQERPTNASVAARVLAQAKAESLWLELISLEKKRLFGDSSGNFSIIPLTNLLRYLEDRAFGRPVDTVNHLHDKPVDLNVTLSLGEGMRLAMQRADERVRSLKR